MTRLCYLTILLLTSLGAAQSPVSQDAKPERIANGFQFVEGPVWKDGVGLLFSDIPANTVYRWTPEAGATEYLRPSGNSNGLTFDLQGRLILTQTGLRRVARQEENGDITSLAASYGGKKLNSPNDLVVKSDGSIFFTDPPFNIPYGQKQELAFSGIFRINPSGNLQLLDSSLVEPNGICFSPDELKLYVNNSSERVIYVWDLINDSTIANKRRFASMSPSGYADGMKVDSQGNIFCTGPLGVWVFAPNGTVLDTILVPGQTSNCNWGDSDRNTLYITAGNSVYRIRPTTTGVEKQGYLHVKKFELYSNYPNPFNPSTVIRYQLSSPGRVKLVVMDMLGREVATLVDDIEETGIQYADFSGRDLSSGIYFARFTVAQQNDKPFVRVKRMVLTK
jgi:gluconolactonase